MFLLARWPIHAFLDIGAGYLLDALETLLPELSGMFHAVELFPPPMPHRTNHPNYVIGSVGDLNRNFDAGVCIEVIEHLTPATLAKLVRQLAQRSNPDALYLFNSAQPSFVETQDRGYLDPLKRGHVVS